MASGVHSQSDMPRYTFSCSGVDVPVCIVELVFFGTFVKKSGIGIISNIRIRLSLFRVGRLSARALSASIL